MSISQKTYTIDEFMLLPEPRDGRRLELVRGEIREKSMAGMEHGDIASNLHFALTSHVRQNTLGRTYVADTSFTIDPVNQIARMPDVAFLAHGRVQGTRKGAVLVPPDLAVEIISPNDNYGEVDDKIAEYLMAGVRLIWIINPRRKTVEIYRPDTIVPKLVGLDGELSGDEVVPGFSIKVRELFET